MTNLKSPSPESQLLAAAEAVVVAYDTRGDMPAAITNLEVILRHHGVSTMDDQGRFSVVSRATAAEASDNG